MEKEAGEFYAERKGNCAQAVHYGWSQHIGENVDLSIYEKNGHGKGDGGICGALNSALEIVGDELKEEVVEEFIRKSGGHTVCRDIRRSKTLSCLECVKHASSIVMELV